jgi:hypothetical protein
LERRPGAIRPGRIISNVQQYIGDGVSGQDKVLVLFRLALRRAAR